MRNPILVITVFSFWSWLLPGWELDDGTLPLPRDEERPRLEGSKLPR